MNLVSNLRFGHVGRSMLVLLICLLCLPFIMAVAPHQAQPPVLYQRYDVTIDVQTNGSFRVREIQEIRFNQEFRTAFAEIPTDLTESIGSIQIYELMGGAEVKYVDATAINAEQPLPYTFKTEREGNSIYIDWTYNPTSAGDVRTFVVEYTVIGGLWIYQEGDILEWRAIPADRSGVPIEASRVTVTLPQTTVAAAMPAVMHGAAYSVRYALNGLPVVEGSEVNQVIFEAERPLPDGQIAQVQVGFPHGMVSATPSLWQIAEDQANLALALPALETTIRVQEDGSLWVEEIHTVAVESGALYESSRTIPTRYVDSLSQISLHEGDRAFVESRSNCEYCMRIVRNKRDRNWVSYDPQSYELIYNNRAAGDVIVAWSYPPLVRGESTTFVLSYRVDGAVQILDSGQHIRWTAVYANRQAPVESAVVYLYLPPQINQNSVRVTGGPVERQEDGALRVAYNGEVLPGQAWEVSVDLPRNATTASASIWQQEIQATIDQAERARVADARFSLAFGTATFLFLVLGIAGLYLIWYTWGRDKPLPEVADYLTEPPSNLPPGIVAYLLDEKPTTKGAMAGLFHLASLGFLELDLENGLRISKVANPPISAEQLPKHLSKLWASLDPVLEPEKDTPFSQIEPRFIQALPVIYAEMGEQVTPYFDKLPGKARQRWLAWGQWGMILAVILALFLAMGYTDRVGWLSMGPAVALFFVGLGLAWISRFMPRRSDSGVEEAQRWRAFKRYLSNLKQYAGVEEAQKILDRYFAYAIALDVEQVVLNSAAEMGTRVPTWSYGPMMRRMGTGRDWTSTPSSSEPIPTGGSLGTPRPPLSQRPVLTTPQSRTIGTTLNDASHSLGRRLSQSSAQLGQVLSTAAGGQSTPFGAIQKGSASTMDILGAILKESSSGGGSSRHSGGSSSHSSSWGSSRSSSSRSSFSSSRSSSSRSSSSSSSRRSSGGGRRGFGR
ncbi:MAG: DUF2207 domain-containing protein [Caldilineaceae bacterium]|nr:DUF2207 domain-containing protein [Caldilineaceae bacterium]